MKIKGIIYLIRNTVNGKLYVGQTKKTIDKRWEQHCSKARRNPTTHFEHAINKYGPDSFTRIQIDSACSFKELDKKEDDWIERYRTAEPDMVYNSLKGGQMRFEYLSKERQQQSIEKLCIANGKGWFDVYDYRDGKLVGSWCNTYEAGRILEVSQQNISHCLTNRVNSLKKYVFVLQREKNYEKVKNKKIKKARKINYHPVICFDLKGNLVGSFDSYAELCKTVGIDSSNIKKVIEGKYAQTNGFILIKKEEYTQELLKVKLEKANQGKCNWFIGFDLITGRQVGRWSSYKQAAIELDLCLSAIRVHVAPSKNDKSFKRVKRYIFILENENIEKVKKQKINAIINCESTLNKSFIRKNPCILNSIK